LRFTRNVAVGSVGLLCLTTCSQRRPLPVNALVPSDAVAMVDVRWQETRSDRRFRQFGLASLEGAVANVGISLEKAERLIVFSSSLAGSRDSETVIVSSPGIGRDRPAAGHRVLVVSDSVIAIGSPESLERVAGVMESKVAPFLARSEFADLANLFTASESLQMAAAWPTEVRDVSNAIVAGSAGLLKLGGLGGLGGVVEKFGIGRAVAMSCAPGGTGLRCRISGVMQDESTASIVSGSLNVAKGLANLLPAPPGAAGPGMSMTDMTVDRRGKTVTMGISLR
jgi:hypothetical protein